MLGISQKGHFHYMPEIEKEAVGFPMMCHLMAKELTEGSSTLFF